MNAVLVIAVLATAFTLVNTQYQSRRLYNEVDQASSTARQLASDFESLRVQRRGEAAPGRVQTIAAKRLGMRAPDPSITEYVSTPGAPTAAQSGAAQ